MAPATSRPRRAAEPTVPPEDRCFLGRPLIPSMDRSFPGPTAHSKWRPLVPAYGMPAPCWGPRGRGAGRRRRELAQQGPGGTQESFRRSRAGASVASRAAPLARPGPASRGCRLARPGASGPGEGGARPPRAPPAPRSGARCAGRRTRHWCRPPIPAGRPGVSGAGPPGVAEAHGIRPVSLPWRRPPLAAGTSLAERLGRTRIRAVGGARRSSRRGGPPRRPGRPSPRRRWWSRATGKGRSPGR